MSADRPLEKLRVLVADDSPAMRGIVRAVLSGFGCDRVFEAENGLQALAVAESGGIDLVICDWKMAPCDGIELVRALRDPARSRDPFLPVIMLTAYSETARVREARDAGATEFLAKPFTAETLYQRIAAVINRPRPFVRADGFNGPDRRRLERDHSGAERRQARQS